MDIHPVFVHFPIALLTLYSVFELVSFGRLRRYASWFYIKLTLVLSGFLLSLITLNTGEVAGQNIDRASSLYSIVETHSQWASATVFIFGVLAAIYFLVWIKNYPECDRVYRVLKTNKYAKVVWRGLSMVADRLYQSPFIWLLALVGLVALTITGALGGSLVYGPNVDPMASLVYRLLGL